MKILSIEQIRHADTYTIDNEPIASIDLMERAASAIFEWLYKHLSEGKVLKIFCGLGNNGGDGLALARLLFQHDIVSQVFVVHYSEKMSRDCKTNYERLKNDTSVPMYAIKSDDDFPLISPNDVVVDAIFGTGLNHPLSGFAANLISYLNQSQCIRLAIDIPSGLYADQLSPAGVIFKADYTLTFQTIKLAFLVAENDAYVGRVEVMDIALHPKFMEEVDTDNILITNMMITPMLHYRTRFSHKGTYGHALLIAGSAGKTGAAMLGARACLRTGVGLLSAHLPKAAMLPMQTTVPEAITDADDSDTCFSGFGSLDTYTAVGVGPGLGKSDDTERALKRLIQDVHVPLVMDADALNILSDNPTWIPFLPAKTILTPHPKEFERLAGKSSNSFESLQKQRDMSVKNNLIIILKGAYTSITMPNGKCFFNSTGNPGLATAGSGDVLTGMVLSLLAQRYSPEEAAVLAVYLHGLAGDLAAEATGQESLIASDIINFIGKAYLWLRNK